MTQKEIKQAITFDRMLNVITVLAAVFIWYVATQSESIAKAEMRTHNQQSTAHPQQLIDIASMKNQINSIKGNVNDLKSNSKTIGAELKELRKEQQEFYIEILNRLPHDN